MMTVQLDRLRTTRTFVAGSERRGAIVCVASWPSLLHSARPQPALGDSAPAGASVALQATGASTGALLPSLGAPVACIVLPGKGVPSDVDVDQNDRSVREVSRQPLSASGRGG